MAEHFCTEHNTKFYENQGKDGKPNWWSHKIQGTGGYCNEKKKEQSSPPAGEVFPGKDTPAPIKEPDYKSPINRSISISYAKDLCVAGKIELKELTAYADKFLAYIEKGD